MTRLILQTKHILILISLLTLACSNTHEITTRDNTQHNESALLKVVSTISPITSIVENIGGLKIHLEGIIPEGVDSHTYAPAPSVATAMSKADLIIVNGLFLEEPTIKMAQATKRTNSVILTLANETITEDEWVFDFSFPKSDGHPNPHLWTDPILALKYANLIRDHLITLDNSNAYYYNKNYAEFESRIKDLDKRIEIAIQSIPPKNRKLLTYHDSFPFFASRYGMEIIGAIQPSNFTEPSARDVATIIDQIKETKVPAIFGSEVYPSKIMKQIAKEGNTEFIDELRDDDLPGSHGDFNHSYLGLMMFNIEIMVPALGGVTDAMSGFDPSPVIEKISTAIYPE